MSTFFQRLEERVHRINSRLCVGIDPHPHLLSMESHHSIKQCLVDWSLQLAQQTHTHAACFKVNIAYYMEATSNYMEGRYFRMDQ